LDRARAALSHVRIGTKRSINYVRCDVRFRGIVLQNSR
jgi:hypothetical protein